MKTQPKENSKKSHVQVEMQAAVLQAWLPIAACYMLKVRLWLLGRGWDTHSFSIAIFKAVCISTRSVQMLAKRRC